MADERGRKANHKWAEDRQEFAALLQMCRECK